MVVATVCVIVAIALVSRIVGALVVMIVANAFVVVFAILMCFQNTPSNRAPELQLGQTQNEERSTVQLTISHEPA